MHDLYKTPRLIGQVLFVVFLLAVLGSQIVSAQTLPPCTEVLASELPDDNDGVPQAVDIDKNNNGLIEICDLEGLNAIRGNLTGQGSIEQGCPTGGCRGFELTKSLDFTDDASYRTTANRVMYTVASPDDDDDTGWEPIGTSADNDNFRARFEGNGHTISNLTINRDTNDIGLFGVAGAGANITHIGLPNVRIEGGNRVGGLVGRNNGGSIMSSYATGDVSGFGVVGGLIGRNNNGSITNSYATGSVSGIFTLGGLVGINNGSITSSYATASVRGNNQVGGLVGDNGGSIVNSYATGSVSGNNNVIGGLVGSNGGSITNSYATGGVEEISFAGGLVGDNETNGSIMNSYATGFRNLVGNTGGSIDANSSTTTLAALKTPTEATGIYEDWSPAVWDFGTSGDLPMLRNLQGIRIRAKVFLEGPLQ